MICVKFFGGLGNQMFQYALGKSLSLKNGSEFVIDSSFYEKKFGDKLTTQRSFELSVFNLKIREVTKKELNILKPLHLRVLNTILIKLGFKGIQFKKYFIEKNICFDSSIEAVQNSCYLSGYWQSYKYFENIKKELFHDFTFPEINDPSILQILDNIFISKSVSLHIRRGDYLSMNKNNKHICCDLGYYFLAIEYFKKIMSGVIFFVFSDDIEWARINLNIGENAVYVTGNVDRKSYLDMQLMSYCKHNIIANSSFSWWGAWLNSNPDKIVIAPKIWFSDERLNNQTYDLIPKEWIRL